MKKISNKNTLDLAMLIHMHMHLWVKKNVCTYLQTYTVKHSLISSWPAVCLFTWNERKTHGTWTTALYTYTCTNVHTICMLHIVCRYKFCCLLWTIKALHIFKSLHSWECLKHVVYVCMYVRKFCMYHYFLFVQSKVWHAHMYVHIDASIGANILSF